MTENRMREDEATRRFPLVSVIIPVYRVETYLDRCLKSVTGQDYTNLQIILVDDGSPDASGRICDGWAERDSRIQVIHKENEGLGMARNSGIECARGEYLLFVDSDDYIAPEMVGKLMQDLERSGGKVCYSGFVDVDQEGRRTAGKPPEKLIYEGTAIRNEFLAEAVGALPETSQNCFAGMSACGALYHASFFSEDGIRFQREQKVLCEDLFFNIEICRHVKSVRIVPECFYYYCANRDSLTKRYRPDRYEAAVRMKKLLERKLLAGEDGDFGMKQRIDRNYMDNLITCMKQEIVYRKQNGHGFCMGRLREMAGSETTCQALTDYPLSRLGGKQRLLFGLIRRKRIWMVYALFRLRYRIE